MVDVGTRIATPDDAPFLWRMLALAASVDEGEDDACVKSDPDLRCYVEGFGRSGDLGVVALGDGKPIGAAWLRLLSGDAHPSKVWTHEMPELAIATAPDARAQGVGTILLQALIRDAAHRYPAIALTVRDGNPAVRLYRRFGFVEERRIVNRVGGVSLMMRRVLP